MKNNIKKGACLLAGLVLTVSTIGGTNVLAAESAQPISVRVNSEMVAFPDAQPYVDGNSRTMIPVRFVTEKLGANVSWDGKTQTAAISKDGTTVNIKVGSKDIAVVKDGKTVDVAMDTVAVVKNDRTYVPIRYVAESLDAWVGYADMYSTVQIYDDVLTPKEINRLHSFYDMSTQEYCKATGEHSSYSDEKVLTLYPEFAHFTGVNGFANANEWKSRNPNCVEYAKYSKGAPITYVGASTKTSFTYGKNGDIEFAKLILAEAKAAEKEINQAGLVSVTLKTDLSCVYASRHANEAGTYVRGVLTVTVPKNANLATIQKTYDFLDAPKVGETREVDVEIYVNTYSETVYWDTMVALK